MASTNQQGYYIMYKILETGKAKTLVSIEKKEDIRASNYAEKNSHKKEAKLSSILNEVLTTNIKDKEVACSLSGITFSISYNELPINVGLSIAELEFTSPFAYPNNLRKLSTLPPEQLFSISLPLLAGAVLALYSSLGLFKSEDSPIVSNSLLCTAGKEPLVNLLTFSTRLSKKNVEGLPVINITAKAHEEGINTFYAPLTSYLETIKNLIEESHKQYETIEDVLKAERAENRIRSNGKRPINSPIYKALLRHRDVASNAFEELASFLDTYSSSKFKSATDYALSKANIYELGDDVRAKIVTRIDLLKELASTEEVGQLDLIKTFFTFYIKYSKELNGVNTEPAEKLLERAIEPSKESAMSKLEQVRAMIKEKALQKEKGGK